MFSIGQHVKAQWTNGNWYGARVLQFNGSMYEVAWDDGSPNLWIGAHQIQQDMGGGAQFAPGQHVKAQWQNGNWYGARIVNFNGSMYEVAWDDGSPNLWIGTHQVQQDMGGGTGAGIGFTPGGAAPPYGGAPAPAPAYGGAPGYNGEANFHPGQHVKAQWTNGNWYGARILSFNGSQYEVAWDDGSPNLWIGRHQVQGDAATGGMERAYTGGGGGYAPGQHVVAQWQNGNWYGARIVAFHGDAIEVAWDDGSPNLWLQPHQIRQG